MTDTLWQSFANAFTTVGEISSLQAACEQAVSEGYLKNFKAGDDGWNYEEWWEDQGYFSGYFIQNVKIRELGERGPTKRMLSIAFSLFRPEDRTGDGWIGDRRAKVYVGVAPVSAAWDEDTLVLDGSGQSEQAVARTPFRWWLEGAVPAWFFCVELEAIDSREALNREIIRPLGALLAGEAEEVAFEGCTATLAPRAVA